MKRVLAFDFGASSGRAILGKFDGKCIELEEIHRFENNPVMLDNTFYWDFLRMFYEIEQGIIKAKNNGGFSSIGIDTWGVDFGLLDKDGRLLENPVHYRDVRTKNIDKPIFYDTTGIQYMEINTCYQLHSLVKNRPELLERAQTMLFMPDLFNYFLTNVKNTERSIASTSGLIDVSTNKWSEKVTAQLDIPNRIFTDICESGSVIGKLKDYEADVIAVCGHDTACAVVAVPTDESDFLYLSCGTWSLLGTEISSAILDDQSITNEGGYGKSIRYLKNISGLWLIQESRREWKRQGKEYSFAELEKLAMEAEDSKCLIDPNFEDFAVAGNIPKHIQEYCKRTNQYVPQTVGEIMRCIYESLASTYVKTKEQIESLTGKKYSKLHMIGGGIKDGFLCQMTANFCKCTVVAGPTEATALGNIAVQLMACGEISNIKQAREIIKNSIDIKEYTAL